MFNLSIIKKLDFRSFLLISTAFFLPVDKTIVPFFVLFLIIEWVLSRRWRYGFYDLTYLGIFSLFYLYQLFSLSWSDNWDYGWQDIGSKITLILFPLIIGTKDPKLNFNRIFEWFVYGTLVLFLINLSSSVIEYSQTKDITEFFYSKFSPQFHVAYASVYCILGIAISYYLYVNSYKFFKNIWLTSGIVLLESVHVVLLNSKASFIAMLFVYLILFLFLLKTSWFKSFIVPAILVFLISVGTLFSFDFLYNRFFGGFEIFKPKEEQTISNQHEESGPKDAEAPVMSSMVRVIAWDAALEIIQKNPFGVGIGDRKDVFIKKVGDRGHKRFVEKGLNTHNQYIQVLLAIGIPGLAIFLLNLFYPVIEAIKIGDFLILSFIANMAINMMFESMLEVQAGIIFYSFFALLLMKQIREDGFTFPKP